MFQILYIFSTLAASKNFNTGLIAKLSAVEMTKVLDNSPRSIVFVTDNESLLNFAYAAVSQYKGQVSFIITSPNEVPPSMFHEDPTLIPFSKSKPMQIEPPPFDSISFIYWVERVIDPSHYNIFVQPQLDVILNGPTAALFQIDIAELPQNGPKDITIFNTTSELFKKFDIDISRGLYVYRPQDRQLIPFNGSFAEQAYSPLKHYSQLSKKSEKKVVAFFVEKYGKEVEQQYKLLSQLHEVYGDKFYYTLINKYDAKKKNTEKVIDSLPMPFFIVANLSRRNVDRWVLIEDVNNFEKLKAFINDIENGNKPTTMISEPIPENFGSDGDAQLQKLVGDNFKEYVYDDSYEAVVLFITDDSIACKVVRPVMSALAKLLGSTYTKFYYFDTSKNDFPKNVPEIKSYPTVIMWPAGKKDEPKIFGGDKLSFGNLLDFVKESAAHTFTVPKFDLNAIKSSITSKINDFLGIDDPRNEI